MRFCSLQLLPYKEMLSLRPLSIVSPCFLSLSSLLLWRPCWAMRWCRLPVGPLMCWPCPLSENYLPGAVEMAVSSPACSSFWLDLNTPAMIYSLHTHLPPRGLFSTPFFSLIPFFFFTHKSLLHAYYVLSAKRR